LFLSICPSLCASFPEHLDMASPISAEGIHADAVERWSYVFLGGKRNLMSPHMILFAVRKKI
ncbi:MAG: hypothetical protein ACPL7J_02435, partial [Desulfomonilaceae bacterium]